MADGGRCYRGAMPSEVLGTVYVLKGGGLLLIAWGGWTLYLDDGIRGTVRIRFSAPEGERIRIADLYLSDLGAADLRRLPLGRLETAVNASHISRRLRASIAAGGTGPENAPDPGKLKFGEGRIGPITIRLPPLKVPAGTAKRPDRFYADVVNHYHVKALETSGPAEALATEVGVPTSTVHRWLREARRRGLMATGKHMRRRRGVLPSA
jgi:hypothetical protein